VDFTSGSWRTDAGGRTLIETPRSQAAAIGIDIGLDAPWVGETEIEARVGWDQAPGGGLRILNVGTHSTVMIAGWHTQARGSRVHFPADSLRALGSEHRVWGGDLAVAARLQVGAVALSPTLSWRRELFEPAEGDVGAFLSTSPDGSGTAVRAAITVAGGAWGGELAYRGRNLDIRSPILRADASAGQLPLAALELGAWSLGAWHRRGTRVWDVSLSAADVDGTLSTRVETWPFASLWQSLSAQAYRLNGGMSGREVWARLRNTPRSGSGWTWGLDLSRIVMRVDRDSWYVTSFGFGRSDRQMTTTGADPAVFVGVEGARRLRAAEGELEVRIEAGAPVRVEELGTGGPAEGGVAGYVRVSLEWVR
jgi:hypothetical protein